MSDVEKEGEHLLEKAEKKLKKWLPIGNKWEEAHELFGEAAAKFKLAKNWRQAAVALSRSADCSLKLDSKFDTASSLTEAAHCYQKVSASQEAAVCLSAAIEHYIDMGRFSSAAKLERELGELYRADFSYDPAIAHLRKAADYYHAEDQTSGMSSCMLIVADLLADPLERFAEATEAYEAVAKLNQSNKLLQYQVKAYYFKAMLCMLANLKVDPISGVEKAKAKLEQYSSWDVHFASGRDFEFLVQMLQLAENPVEEEFFAAVKEYNSIQALDDWKSSMIVKVKQAVLRENVKEDGMDLT